MASYAFKRAPTKDVAADENAAIIRSKFAGYCPACDLMLTALDKTEGGKYRCPRCNGLSDKPSKTKKTVSSWT